MLWHDVGALAQREIEDVQATTRGTTASGRDRTRCCPGTLLQALRSDSEEHFARLMTGDESWFSYSYELLTMFGHRRDEVIPKVSQTIGSKKAMTTMFFAGVRLLKLVHLPGAQSCKKVYNPPVLHWITV
jgi:hypothetical protein